MRIIPRFRTTDWTIGGRLLGWFLAISLIPCAVLTLVLSLISTNSLRNSVRRDLQVISASKASELETFALGRIHEVTAIAQVPSMIEAAVKLGAIRAKEGLDTPAYHAEEALFRPFLTRLSEAFDYPNLLLFSPGGELLFRLKDDLDVGPRIQEGPYKDTELAGVVDRRANSTANRDVRLRGTSRQEGRDRLHREPGA